MESRNSILLPYKGSANEKFTEIELKEEFINEHSSINASVRTEV
jgi:hypothetical protein